ncbi:MAG: YchF/TatD family DNA exonuclease [Candidatus Edwardsbacteria bacterium]|nr:YchF/TatD family DNA exonuclease [Candidatus Edwardsbacteria bacterium]MBU1575675.1 YchF/TatD family DNA exonuclease [Candidatus Edwardsbacteria bacterium]MBU2463766.1 YchF/TatD family DNA exonuclease [Candidatus Edwardsbacteria bacterium]MBU2594067.1 YchF/TatD family DNA exonuclease [Candidatus Edwardsbacteria bacterium]
MNEPDKTKIIDTHAHLTKSDYKNDRDQVIKRAQDAGVEYIINVGYDLKTSRASVELAEKHDCCYAAVGIHPHDAKTLDEKTFKELEVLAKNPKVVAIGEMGLDFHRNLSPKEIQVEAFKKQLAWAETLNLPVVVHDRDAHQEVMDILKEHPGLKIVLHCFAGDVEMAKESKRRGYLLSAGGPITFKNSKHLPEVLKTVELESLMLETDCPYLAPEPHRGQRNEPAYLEIIARKVAEILSPLTYDDVCRVTTLNAKKFFNIGRIDPAKIAYQIRDSLYLNITNRCTNSCLFCIRQKTDFIKGHNLRLEREPDFQEVVDAIGDPSKYREVVFCGYGEPLLRLDLVKQVAGWLKSKKTHVRINTNGQGNLIAGRDIIPELKGLIDEVSISLNAGDQETYDRICPSRFSDKAFAALLDFAKGCRSAGIKTTVTVMDMPGVDIEKAKQTAKELGVNIRIRHYDVVG